MLLFFVKCHAECEFPGRFVIPLQNFRIRFAGVEVAEPARFTDQRQNQFAQLKGDTIAVDGSLRFCLLCVPIGAFGSASRQVGQNPSIVAAVDRLGLAGTQFEGFEFSPLLVGPSLTLRGLNHELPGGSAVLYVDFIVNIPLTSCLFFR